MELLSEFSEYTITDLCEEIIRLRNQLEIDKKKTIEARRTCPDCKVTRVFDSMAIHLVDKKHDKWIVSPYEALTVGNVTVRNTLNGEYIYLNVEEFKREVNDT